MAETRIPAASVPAGTMRGIDHAGTQVVLCHVNGAWYAMDDWCPHGVAKFSNGDLEGEMVICPLHRGRWDIKTGKPVYWVADRANTYRVRRDGDDVVVE